MARKGIRVSVREKDHGLARLMKLGAELKSGETYIKVGVLDDGKGAEVRDGDLTNAQIAAIHEFGSKDGVIPERSFVRSTMDTKRGEHMALLRKLLTAVVSGKMELRRALDTVGLQAANDIKARVYGGEPIPPPNAPSVLARKEGLTRKGSKGPVRTLVDTGRMIASVTWATVIKGRG